MEAELAYVQLETVQQEIGLKKLKVENVSKLLLLCLLGFHCLLCVALRHALTTRSGARNEERNAARESSFESDNIKQQRGSSSVPEGEVWVLRS